MFKKIIDATVAFFKGPQPAPVVPEAPYKLEAPVVAETTVVVDPGPTGWAGGLRIQVPESVPVVEAVKKPRKPRAPKVEVKPVAKKPAAKKVPAKKTTKPKA
jgi:hypothetical protein